MRDKAAEAGLNDAIIFNTCAVTSEAEKQARQSIRKWRKERPDAKIIVTGAPRKLTQPHGQICQKSILWSAIMTSLKQLAGNHLNKVCYHLFMSVM